MEDARAASGPTCGDRLHRLAFGALAAAPPVVAHPARRAVFNRFYRRTGDPWGYSRSPWEGRRHAALVDACPSRDVQWALDVGCGTGHLTRALLDADVARSVVGIDISPHAVRRAAAENLRLAQGFRSQFLEVDLADHGQSWFDGRFDLAVCADVLYYLPRPHLLSHVVDRLVSWTTPGGALLLAHPVSHADHLHEAAHAHASLVPTHETYVDGPQDDYRIEVFTRSPT